MMTFKGQKRPFFQSTSSFLELFHTALKSVGMFSVYLRFSEFYRAVNESLDVDKFLNNPAANSKSQKINRPPLPLSLIHI